MTMVTGQLTEALQGLVDARLDTIDRMLVGRMARQDRLAIVREVESQVFELLREHGGDEPDRDDVLAALGRLDPPEAYLPDEWGATRVAPATPREARPRTEPRVEQSRLGSRACGALGITALLLPLTLPLFYLLAIAIENEIVLFGGIAVVAASTLTGLAALIVAAYVRFRGSWALAGAITGGLALIFDAALLLFALYFSVVN